MAGSARKAETASERMDRRAAALNKTIAGLKSQVLGLIGAYAGFQGIRSLIQMADQYSNINARLRIVTKSQQEFNVAQRETFAIAQRTSTPLEITAKLYGRIHQSLRDMGGSQKLALSLTETINQAFAVSGASAAEASGAITQLLQGFSNGALRGEEFNSVMEQAPRIADALSRSLGVTRGELRQMAEDGKLTTATVVRALQEQARAIDEEFSKLPITIERAWQQLSNSVLKFIGETDSGLGASSTLAQGILLLSQNVGTLANALITTGGIIATVYGARLLASIYATTAAIVSQRVALGVAGAQWQALGIQATGATSSIYRGLMTVQNGLSLAAAALVGWQIGRYLANEFRIVADAGDNLVYGVAQGFANLRSSVSNAFLYIKFAGQKSFEFLREQIADTLDALVGLSDVATPWWIKPLVSKSAADSFKKLSDEIRGTSTASEDLQTGLALVEDQLGKATAQNLEMLDSMRDATDAKFNGVRASEDLAEAEGDLTDETVKGGKAAKDAREEYEKLFQGFAGFAGNAVQAAIDTAKATQALRDNLQARREQAEAAGISAAAVARLAAIQQINNEFTKEGTNLTDEQIEAMRRQALAYYDLEVANREFREESERALQESTDAWRDFTGELVDAAFDGTESVKDMFDRMLKDMAKQLLQSGLLNLFSSIFGGSIPGLSAAAAGGGQQSLLGSLFSGGTSSSGGILGSIVSGIGSFFGFGGGAATGITAAAGTATGVTGTAAAAGFTGGANAAANTGGFSSLFGGGGSSFAGIPVVGWILAGMALSNSLFSQGWASNGGSTTLPNGETVRGGGSSLGRIVDTLGIISNPLIGLLGDRAAAIFSGSPAINALFGRKAPRLTDGETTFGFGPGGISGSERYRTLEEGGVFRSDRRRWHDFELSDESAAYAQDIFDSLGATIRNASAQLGSDAEVNFQAAMRVIQKFNKKGEVESTQLFVDVLGRSFAAATEEEALTRLGAEAIIAAIDASMGGVADAMGQGIVDAAEQGAASGGRELGGIVFRDLKSAAIRGEASAIAERWRNDAYKLAEGAQFLLSAASDINAGYALLGDESSLTQIADLTEELAKEGETLLQTYERIVVATKLLEDALELTGIEMDKTREEVVRFAVDIVDAAGGLDRASQLWSTFFGEFFSDQEIAQMRLDRANQIRKERLEALGLDPNISNEDFRERFTEIFPTLTPAQVVLWLEAGEAIAIANDAQDAYNQTLGETAEVAPAALDALQDHLDALRQARDDYASFAAGLRRESERMGLNEFQLEMRDIAEWTKENIRTLNELARAAGYAAANEQDLALVHQIAAARAAEAIARLTNAARSLVEQLYGGGDAGTTLIDNTQGFIDTALGGIGEIGAATNDLYQSQLAAIQNIQAYLDSQLLSDTSSLTPFERLNEARRQFEEMFQRALSGDVDALNDIPGLADILLRLGREYDPSDYPELEAWVRSMLQQLTAIVPQEPPTGTGTDPTGGAVGGGQFGDVTGAINDGTQTISDERAALVAELFEMVRDLMDATGQSLSEVAQSIGLNVQDFIRDLGVNLDELTVETTLQLATIASRLGISLEELAGQVGVDLGNLADAQSLLNQALGQTIQGLPEEDRRVLQPLFDRIASATTAADANAAIDDLTQAAQAIGGDTALALQPFLSGINIVTPIQTTNAHLDTLVGQGADQLLELQNIVNELRGTGSGPGLPGTGGGSGGGGLPGTGGLPGPTAQGTAQQVTSLLEGIVTRLDRVEAATTHAGTMTVDAISGEQAKRVRAAEAAKDAALTARRA